MLTPIRQYLLGMKSILRCNARPLNFTGFSALSFWPFLPACPAPRSSPCARFTDYSSPTVARSPSASCAPRRNWAFAPSPSTRRKTAFRCTARRRTRLTWWARARGPSRLISIFPTSSVSPWKRRRMLSTRATVFFPRTQSLPRPALKPASSSLAPRRPPCARWATRCPRAISPWRPVSLSCRPRPH